MELGGKSRETYMPRIHKQRKNMKPRPLAQYTAKNGNDRIRAERQCFHMRVGGGYRLSFPDAVKLDATIESTVRIPAQPRSSNRDPVNEQGAEKVSQNHDTLAGGLGSRVKGGLRSKNVSGRGKSGYAACKNLPQDQLQQHS